jgi:L-fuculose-phosphate aldolase
MEWCAQVQWHCMAAGKMNVLTDEQMEVAMEHYKTYGQKKSDGSHSGGYSVV